MDCANLVIENTQLNLCIHPTGGVCLELSPQGPPGPNGDLLYLIAGMDLGGNRAVAMNADGDLVYADSSNLLHIDKVIGITTGSVINGDICEVRLSGLMQDASFNFDADGNIYLGSNGLLTQVVSSSGFVCQLGIKINSKELFIDIRQSIRLV